MNLKFVVTAVFIAISFSCLAQESTILGDVDNSLLQKYIQLARQNYPRRKLVEAREMQAKAALNSSQFSYLDMFNANYYWSPRRKSDSLGIGGVAANNTIMQRGFMAGVSLNLGQLLSRPSQVKAAKANLEAAKAETQEYDVTLVNDVKSRYYTYLLAKKMLQIRTIALQNSKTLMADVNTKYQTAQIPIDVYSSARTTATETEAAGLAAEVDFLRAKNSLEEIIGVRLEDVR